jgi:hypothetical protein
MGGGNDAGGVSVYAQMGQDYGMKLSYNPHLLPGRAAPRCSTPRYMAGTGTARSAAETVAVACTASELFAGR